MKHHMTVLAIACLMILTLSACSAGNGTKTEDTSANSEVTASSTATNSPTPIPAPTLTPTPTLTVDLSLFTIQPRYVSASLFNADGYASVSRSNADGEVECFIIDAIGSEVFGPVDSIWLAESPYFSPFCENGKWGYINSDFEVVIEPEYDNVQLVAADGCYAVEADGKWGRINRDNEWVCEPQFEEIGFFYSDGLIAAKLNNYFVLMDPSGNIITSTGCSYDTTRYSSETKILRFHKNGGYGLMNKSGEVILEPDYSYIAFPEDGFEYGIPNWESNGTGLFLICTGENNGPPCGLVNSKGEIIFEPIAEVGIEFADNGLASVLIDGKMGYINAKGEMVIEPQFSWAYEFNEHGLAKVELDSGEIAYIDESGEVLDPDAIDVADTFDYTKNGISFGIKDGVTGLYNSKGECIFDSQGYFPNQSPEYGDELYLFIYEDKSVFIDLYGNIIAEYSVMIEHYFVTYDTFLFAENDKYGMMDKAGNRLIEPLFDGVYGSWNTNDHEGPYFNNQSSLELAMTAMYGHDVSDPNLSLYGILAYDGQELIPPISPNYIEVSANGMVPIQVGDMWGYIQIDVNG